MIHNSYVSEAALPPVCPVRHGYASNPLNCSEYVVCLNFDVTAVGACPTNRFFSQSKSACVSSSNCTDVNCKCNFK